MELLKITKQVTDALQAIGTPCVIVGSVASSRLGVVRATLDCTSERQWRDVLGLLRFSELDLEYTKHWAGEIGVLDLLERALGEV
jgi:hypothetical protein